MKKFSTKRKVIISVFAILLIGSILILTKLEMFNRPRDQKKITIKDSLLDPKKNVTDSKSISKIKNEKRKKEAVQEKKNKISKSDAPKKASEDSKPKALDAKKESELKKIKSKIQKKSSIKKKKVILPKYSKRFLQIDSNSGKYKIVNNMYAIANNGANRSKYPKAEQRGSHLLVKTKNNMTADSILQNKETNNYAIFNRVVKFKTKKEKSIEVQEDLKNFKYKNLNELSMINDEYEMKFQSAKEALEAYEIIRKSSYIIYSSINVLEYVRIN